MPEQPNQFVKVTPDLTDPRQNEFVQDYLSKLQQAEFPIGRIGDNDLIEATIEMVQEIYSPTPPPMTRLKDLTATEVILNYDLYGTITSAEVKGTLLDGTPAWVLIHNHGVMVRVSRVPPEPDE